MSTRSEPRDDANCQHGQQAWDGGGVGHDASPGVDAASAPGFFALQPRSSFGQPMTTDTPVNLKYHHPDRLCFSEGV
jgi:hypothetical protein